jgi:predicted acyl esterase
MRLPLLLLASVLAGRASAQACARPQVVGAGHATILEPTEAVTYSDNYQTEGNLVRPDLPVPPCRWPLVVQVHPLGDSRASSLPWTTAIAAQGYAVWVYDVRGQGAAQGLNLNHPQPGTTVFGPAETYDLAEQIQHVSQAHAGIVDTGRLAVLGVSQGGAHAWIAAAESGRPLTVAGRGTITFPTVRCVAALDYVAEPTAEWLRGGTLFSSWFTNLICDDVVPSFALDTAFRDRAAAAFRDQDPASLLASFAAEGRPIEHLLGQSTVPIFFAHSYHDSISGPLSALPFLSGRTDPNLALFSTGGHNTPANRHESTFRNGLIVRWLDRFLWDEPNEIDLEQRFVSALLPLDRSHREDPDQLWGRSPGGDPLAPLVPNQGSAQRFFLVDDGTLAETAPTASSALPIDHVIGSGAFRPHRYLADAAVRQLGTVLAACPLSELVYSMTLPAEAQLEFAPALSLLVTPQESRFMVAALLTVQPAGGEETMLSSMGVGVLDAVPQVPRRVEFRLPPVATVLPANSTLRLRLRNHWLRESPQTRALEVAPLFVDFHVLVAHGDATTGSWLDLGLADVRPQLLCRADRLDHVTLAPIDFHLRTGSDLANGAYYLTFGSSGQVPVTNRHGTALSLDADWLTYSVESAIVSPFFTGFLGDISPEGTATARLDLSFVGTRLTFGAFVFPSMFSPTAVSSTPVDLLIR